jgi:hypothetical protein
MLQPDHAEHCDLAFEVQGFVFRVHKYPVLQAGSPLLTAMVELYVTAGGGGLAPRPDRSLWCCDVTLPLPPPPSCPNTHMHIHSHTLSNPSPGTMVSPCPWIFPVERGCSTPSAGCGIRSTTPATWPAW